MADSRRGRPSVAVWSILKFLAAIALELVSCVEARMPISPERIKAIRAFEAGKVQTDEVRLRPGAGGIRVMLDTFLPKAFERIRNRLVETEGQMIDIDSLDAEDQISNKGESVWMGPCEAIRRFHNSDVAETPTPSGSGCKFACPGMQGVGECFFRRYLLGEQSSRRRTRRNPVMLVSEIELQAKSSWRMNDQESHALQA
jgi:hypothetical protein